MHEKFTKSLLIYKWAGEPDECGLLYDDGHKIMIRTSTYFIYQCEWTHVCVYVYVLMLCLRAMLARDMQEDMFQSIQTEQNKKKHRIDQSNRIVC